jgi:7,8-dihydropterin-6-yl-methyl-4-(beta-D-ribofuranosyl)aminobenzene 5'-phosphate synthase
VGCGHQTIPKLLTRVQETFDLPIYAVIGDLHYPVPKGRRVKLGIDRQRTFASGSSPFAPIAPKDVQADLDSLAKTVSGFVALGTHDSSDDVLTQFEARLGPRFKRVLVGEEIRL